MEWQLRTLEEFRLFNPAFCGLLIGACTHQYQLKLSAGLPLVLGYMLLPLVLHKETRAGLPKRSNAMMHGWLQENGIVRIAYYERLMALKKQFFEGMLYIANEDWIDVSNGTHIKWIESKKPLSSALKLLDGDAQECFKSAQFVGKWFASTGSCSSILSMWGLLP